MKVPVSKNTVYYVSATLYKMQKYLIIGVVVGLVALRKIEDKCTNFGSNSFGMHNIQRIRRERCLLNWIICFGLKGNKLFLVLYLWCE